MNNESISTDETSKGDRHRKLKKGVFIVPSIITIANIFCGFHSVIESMKGFQQLALGPDMLASATRHFDLAAISIGFAVLFDFLDGRIARMANATSEFGVELDSIADVLSFGIAPAVLAYTWGYGSIPGFQKLAWAVSFMFLVCGALRLARFNVQARKPVAQETHPKLAKKYFLGMPIPAGASLIAAIVHFTPRPLIARTEPNQIFNISLDSNFYGFLMLLLVAILALLMVSTVRYNSFKGAGPHNANTRRTVILIAVVMFAIYTWSQVTLLVMAVCYVSMGPLGKLLSMLRPRQSSIPPEAASASR
jgi:CDP-diacylglycerol---serine O-phosphatidyltransferase